MKNQSLDRLEIFLLLALRRQAQNSPATRSNDFLPTIENESPAESLETPAEFPAIFNYLNEADTEKFRRLLADYQDKTEAEKKVWQRQTRKKIGADERVMDERIHHSHVSEALQKEIPAVRQIIAAALPLSYRQSSDSFTGRKKKKAGATADFDSLPTARKIPSGALAKTVRRAFAKQFVALRDLVEPTAFDSLTGAQLARLIRLTGIQEVALACVRIEAVESVAAFLRRFSAEDAQAIAAQLNRLAAISDERLAFAEHLVQTTLESEPQPSAMLDLLGISQISALLYGESPERIRYANQKLPLEIAPRLNELVAEQRDTPAALRTEISREIEQLAETLHAHGKR